MGTAKMKSGKKYTVIGTPEFMAPEMYEEKGYSEKVDVYAFGMVLLELATGDYPYSECKNAAQIYKKVISGIKPECLGLIEDETMKSLVNMCIAPEHERLSVRQIFDHPFYAQDPEVILLAVDDMRYILTLQVVFRGSDRISIKFEYSVDSDTPEDVVNEMISEKVLSDKYKYHVIIEINRILREFHLKFPFAMDALQQQNRRSSPESSSEHIAHTPLGAMSTPTTERTVYLRHAPTQSPLEESSLSPSNLSWKRESQYKTEMHRMQKEMQRAHDRAVEAERRARDLEAKILSSHDKHEVVVTAQSSASPLPSDFVIHNDTLIEELVHEVAVHAQRGPDKASEWVAKLHEQDILAVRDLKALHEEDWNNLNLTVFACRALKNAISGKKPSRPQMSSPSMSSHDG